MHLGQIFIDLMKISPKLQHLDDVVNRNAVWHKDRVGTFRASATLCFNPFLAS